MEDPEIAVHFAANPKVRGPEVIYLPADGNAELFDVWADFEEQGHLLFQKDGRIRAILVPIDQHTTSGGEKPMSSLNVDLSQHPDVRRARRAAHRAEEALRAPDLSPKEQDRRNREFERLRSIADAVEDDILEQAMTSRTRVTDTYVPTAKPGSSHWTEAEEEGS